MRPRRPEIHAPFSDEQVEALTRFQQGGFMHPFTCRDRNRHAGRDDVLVPTATGWYCPDEGCDYTQYWAHSWMADLSWVNRMESQQRELLSFLHPD